MQADPIDALSESQTSLSKVAAAALEYERHTDLWWNARYSPHAPPTRRVANDPRSDWLPENTTYVDAGCSIQPACLTCPLPQCRYEGAPRAHRGVIVADRYGRVVELRQQGLSIDAIASAVGLKHRQVYSALAAARVGA